MTLAGAMAKVVGSGKKSVADIVAGIPGTGHKPKSADLTMAVGVHLAQHKKRFHRIKRGVYVVKKSS